MTSTRPAPAVAGIAAAGLALAASGSDANGDDTSNDEGSGPNSDTGIRINVGLEIALPGGRVTLWLAGLFMLLTGLLAAVSLRGLRPIRAGRWQSTPPRGPDTRS